MKTLKERLENFHKNECTKGYMSNADYQKRVIEIGEAYAEEYHKEKTKSNRLEKLGYTTVVKWEHEDELPEDLTDEEYNKMFPLSKVILTRRFPYVEINGIKYYLKEVV